MPFDSQSELLRLRVAAVIFTSQFDGEIVAVVAVVAVVVDVALVDAVAAEFPIAKVWSIVYCFTTQILRTLIS